MRYAALLLLLTACTHDTEQRIVVSCPTLEVEDTTAQVHGWSGHYRYYTTAGDRRSVPEAHCTLRWVR